MTPLWIINLGTLDSLYLYMHAVHLYLCTVEAKMIRPPGIIKHFPKILPNVGRIHNIQYNEMFTTAINLLVNFGMKKYMMRLYIK